MDLSNLPGGSRLEDRRGYSPLYTKLRYTLPIGFGEVRDMYEEIYRRLLPYLISETNDPLSKAAGYNDIGKHVQIPYLYSNELYKSDFGLTPQERINSSYDWGPRTTGIENLKPGEYRR